MLPQLILLEQLLLLFEILFAHHSMAHRSALTALEDPFRQCSLPTRSGMMSHGEISTGAGMRHRIVTESSFATAKHSSDITAALFRARRSIKLSAIIVGLWPLCSRRQGSREATNLSASPPPQTVELVRCHAAELRRRKRRLPSAPSLRQSGTNYGKVQAQETSDIKQPCAFVCFLEVSTVTFHWSQSCLRRSPSGVSS